MKQSPDLFKRSLRSSIPCSSCVICQDKTKQLLIQEMNIFFISCHRVQDGDQISVIVVEYRSVVYFEGDNLLINNDPLH